jgi:hypothetical protein
MEVISQVVGKRMIEVINSNITLYNLHQKISKLLNIHPLLLQAQYCLSTDNKTALPCNLQTHGNMNTMLTMMCSLVVPPQLANGHPSQCKMKAVALQVFNKGDGPFQVLSDRKVSVIFFICLTILIII